MEYKFVKNNYCSDKVPSHLVHYDYGVKTFNKEIEALEQIESGYWTSEEVQNMLDEINSITNKDFEYYVEGGHLLIVADKEETHLFNLLNREQKKADIIWSTEKFIKFLKEFKDFLQKNGR